MNNSEVAKIYANSTKEAKTDNLFIYGLDIFSYGYHFKIAHKESNKVVLFNTLSYSQTTAKHKSLVLNELNKAHFKIIFVYGADTDNLNKQISINKKGIADLLLKKTKTERTTALKNERIKFLKEQNSLINNLSI